MSKRSNRSMARNQDTHPMDDEENTMEQTPELGSMPNQKTGNPYRPDEGYERKYAKQEFPQYCKQCTGESEDYVWLKVIKTVGPLVYLQCPKCETRFPPLSRDYRDIVSRSRQHINVAARPEMQ